MVERIAVFGSSGAIGGALVRHLSAQYPAAKLYALSRHDLIDSPSNVFPMTIKNYSEAELEKAAEEIKTEGRLDMVVVANGLLHEHNLMPEKSLRDMSPEKFHRLFEVNAVLPAMIAKHFLPVMHKDRRAVFAAISARVGSIGDNHLGGWYAYRTSKAALNMIIKNAAIETARQNKDAVIVGLHPGTVDSSLSKPFQGQVAEGRLFTPEQSAQYLIGVLAGLGPDQSGKCFGWDGKEIEP